MWNTPGLLAPNGTRVETPASISARTAALVPALQTLNRELMREYGAALNPPYSNPITGLGGAHPSGLGFAFGDSWARTQRGIMEFSLPVGQVDNMNMAFRYAFENLFIAKGLRLRTQFTCTGLQNSTDNDTANDFFDQVIARLNLHKIYRLASWLYDAVGLAPILLPPPGKPLDYVEVLDPRMVRTFTAYGKTKMWIVVDEQMTKAYEDQEGRTDPRNKAYWDAMPVHWRAQIMKIMKSGLKSKLIELKDGEYLILENRLNAIDRTTKSWDGCPLQPYFAACEEYRMHMAADFATAFLAKNLIALVSVGDPKAEGENYIRPDDNVLNGLASAIGTPNMAQYIYGDPTMQIRYITPDPNTWNDAKYTNCKELLKNFLPSPFWYNDGSGSYASSTVEIQAIQEEIKFKNSDFDRGFWEPLYERAATGRVKIPKKACKAPKHDINAMMDQVALATKYNNLYANGGLDIRSLIEMNGLDPDVVAKRLKEQQKDVKSGLYMPAFEQKQGIVAEETYGIGKDAPLSPSSGGGKNGRPSKPGSRPQSESKQGRRTPRPRNRNKA